MALGFRVINCNTWSKISICHLDLEIMFVNHASKSLLTYLSSPIDCSPQRTNNENTYIPNSATLAHNEQYLTPWEVPLKSMGLLSAWSTSQCVLGAESSPLWVRVWRVDPLIHLYLKIKGASEIRWKSKSVSDYLLCFLFRKEAICLGYFGFLLDFRWLNQWVSQWKWQGSLLEAQHY